MTTTRIPEINTYAVTIHPGARRDGVTELSPGMLKVETTQPARDNRANLALVELVADYLHVKKSQVLIKSGEKSRRKQILILRSGEN